MFTFDPTKAEWKNPPEESVVTPDKVVITTQPVTDLWQRSYYGFQHDNGTMLLLPTTEQYFSFTVRTDFDSTARFDQCGVVIYQDSDNWFKASIERENSEIQRLGSVVTNHGYSDWATADIPAEINTMYYRLSRREDDYCIEQSVDGKHFQQMRIFHLFEGKGEIYFGLYACSPTEASFHATFTEMSVTECVWEIDV
ncbi:MAG: DUF1349 domain-containing protein [Massiliimalia sp.]|jgi:regulation of enolase protein 1 (concanavalin A-like superfamily)